MLRQSRPLRQTRPLVIVIAAHGDMSKAVRAMRAGAYDFIAKPFDAATIQLVVRRALETRGLKTQVHHLRKELNHTHLWVRGADPTMARIAARHPSRRWVKQGHQ